MASELNQSLLSEGTRSLGYVEDSFGDNKKLTSDLLGVDNV